MFQSTARRLMQYVGDTRLSDLPKPWQVPVDKVLTEQENEDPRIKMAEIRDSKPHPSNDDPDDPQDVISVRLLDGSQKRIASIHIHEDATSKKVTWR